MNVQKCSSKSCKNYFTANKGYTNCALKNGVYPYCSEKCARNNYWNKDLFEVLNNNKIKLPNSKTAYKAILARSKQLAKKKP